MKKISLREYRESIHLSQTELGKLVRSQLEKHFSIRESELEHHPQK